MRDLLDNLRFGNFELFLHILNALRIVLGLRLDQVDFQGHFLNLHFQGIL